MKRKSDSWEAILVAAIVLVAGVCAQAQQTVRAADAELNGPIVEIAPDEDGRDIAELAAEPKTRIVDEPSYWIGIRGRSIESEVLRTHLQLAEDMGVVVEEVIPDSPAAKAGLRKHDIILRANGDAVDNMQVMQKHVREYGEKPIELKIIRLGKHEKLVVVPELRPEEFSEPAAGDTQGFHPDRDRDAMQKLLEQLRKGGFQPGIRLEGRQFDFNAIPNGVSVSVQRQNDGPPQITVKKDGKTWNIEGDDEEALDQLPDDVRPFVERMLRGQGVRVFGGEIPFDFNAELQRVLPRGLGGEVDDDPIAQRMKELERKLQDLQKRLEQDPAVK